MAAAPGGGRPRPGCALSFVSSSAEAIVHLREPLTPPPERPEAALRAPLQIGAGF